MKSPSKFFFLRHTLRRLIRPFKHCIQRCLYGFDDSATWHVRSWHEETLLKVLKRFQEKFYTCDVDWEIYLKNTGINVESELEWSIKFLETKNQRRDALEDLEIEYLRQGLSGKEIQLKQPVIDWYKQEEAGNIRLINNLREFWW